MLAAVGPIEWNGEDQIMESGPAATEGGYVPLQVRPLECSAQLPLVPLAPKVVATTVVVVVVVGGVVVVCI